VCKRIGLVAMAHIIFFLCVGASFDIASAQSPGDAISAAQLLAASPGNEASLTNIIEPSNGRLDTLKRNQDLYIKQNFFYFICKCAGTGLTFGLGRLIGLTTAGPGHVRVTMPDDHFGADLRDLWHLQNGVLTLKSILMKAEERGFQIRRGSVHRPEQTWLEWILGTYMVGLALEKPKAASITRLFESSPAQGTMPIEAPLGGLVVCGALTASMVLALAGARIWRFYSGSQTSAGFEALTPLA